MEHLRNNIVHALQKVLTSITYHSQSVVVAYLTVAGVMDKVCDISCDTDFQVADISCFNETHLDKSDHVSPIMIG